jgi:hypothetical protein
LKKGPEPILLGKMGFNKEGTGHRCGGMPLAFNRAILRLPTGRGRTNLNAFAVKEVIYVVLNETGIKITLDLLGNTASVNKE